MMRGKTIIRYDSESRLATACMPTWSLLQIREAWRWHIHQIFPCTRMHAPGSSRCTSLSLKKAKQCSYSVRIVRCSSCFLQLVKTERVSTTRSVSHKIRAGFRQAESLLHFSFQATSAARTLWRRGLSVYFLTYPDKLDYTWKAALSFRI